MIIKPSNPSGMKMEEKPTEWSSKTPSLEEWEERDAWALGLIIYNTKKPCEAWYRHGWHGSKCVDDPDQKLWGIL